MKYLTALIMIVLIGCKKEETPDPVIPTTLSNHFNINGTEVPLNNDDTAYYWVSNNVTTLSADANGRFMVLSFPGNDTGSFHMVGNVNPFINVLYLNEGYSRPDIWIYVTRYDSVGGKVQGTFIGTFKQNTDTTVILNASGGFSLTRIPDIP